HPKVRGVQLQVGLALTQICATVEPRLVDGQPEPAGGLDHVAETGLLRPFPAHDDVAEGPRLAAVDEHLARLDEDLGATRDGTAVIRDPAGEGARLPRHGHRAEGFARVGGWQPGAPYPEQGRDESDADN